MSVFMLHLQKIDFTTGEGQDQIRKKWSFPTLRSLESPQGRK